MSDFGFVQSECDVKVFLSGSRLYGVIGVTTSVKRSVKYLPTYGDDYGSYQVGHIHYEVKITRSAPANQPVDWLGADTLTLRICGNGEDWEYPVTVTSVSESVDKRGNTVSVVELVASRRYAYEEEST